MDLKTKPRALSDQYGPWQGSIDIAKGKIPRRLGDQSGLFRAKDRSGETHLLKFQPADS